VAYEDDLQVEIIDILSAPWDTRDGQVVPSTENVKLRDGAVEMDATFLYADLAESSALQKDYLNTFAAKALRMYLHGAASIIRHFDGSVRSFDGDRVMGVFVGSSMRNNAVRAAFAIHWLLFQVIAPQVKKRHESNGTSVWVPSHGIGIDCSKVFIARAGVHNRHGETNHNDLIFVGRAPNVAAKLSALRGANAGPIIVTDAVYSQLNDAQKQKLNGTSGVWGEAKVERIGPFSLSLRRADYWGSPNAKKP
jgi:class 3 adenylate cyclase